MIRDPRPLIVTLALVVSVFGAPAASAQSGATESIAGENPGLVVELASEVIAAVRASSAGASPEPSPSS